MSSRVALSAALTVLALGTCLPGSEAVAQDNRPTSEATQAFGRWIHARYRVASGYWVCPKAQVFGTTASCLAEVRARRTRHLISASARGRGSHLVFIHVTDIRWVRRWSTISNAVLRKGANDSLPGKASVNTPAFDWWWLASGAYSSWKRRRRSFGVNAYDGDSAGFGRFYNFGCHVEGRVITCANSLGDAMRYLP